MRKRNPQLQLLSKQPLSYGGELLKKRSGRSGSRPLATKSTMHLVLRSTKAKGAWSFKRPQNEQNIKKLIEKFSHRYGVQILRVANVGNHLHLQIRLTNRHVYRAFIRGLTSSIAIAVTGIGRGRSMKSQFVQMQTDHPSKDSGRHPVGEKMRFWDCRPFSRIIAGLRAFLSLRDYIEINRLEGFGYSRHEARYLITRGRDALPVRSASG